MNTPQKPLFILLSLGLFISAQAQRNEGRGQRNNSYPSRSSGNYSRQNNDFGQRASNRSYDFNRQNNGAYDRRVVDRRIYDPNTTRQNNSVSRRNDMPSVYNDRTVTRNAVLGNQRGYDPASQRANRTVIVNNNYRMTSINSYPAYSRYPTVYSYGRGGYSFVRYNYYAPRSYFYVGAPRYAVMPRSFVSITFGGYPYWYDGGCFYGYYGGYYQPVFAPIGIHVSILPFGYFPIYVGPSMYYYYNGIYYRRFQDRNDEYEVVDAPMGAVVKSLPKGATKVVLNGEKLYEFDGTYYKEGTNNKNEVVYTVVGKNGVINNTDQQPQQQPAATSHAPQVGDEITALPDNSKQVTINGDVLYVTPDNLYLKAQTVDNTTTYKVVGRAE
ncbi:MAG TPA: DUF6515 family protein [Flavisolibacter sp.]